ncbi:hypothetical protein EVAR_50621_1 [Eumeta japonica]|uniref:Uncharacterized protein n=1 Tax=Eumeta variegata TaxID=151549 RepID=A0A4C1XIJ2_EUMVA|nr:hypothetical protein EVAR_50621_1 [Eumeta japonica]
MRCLLRRRGGMRSGEAGEGSELSELGARWPPAHWPRSATPHHPAPAAAGPTPAHHLARHSRSHQVLHWLQDNRHASYEAEDARVRTRSGTYYSPPGTSYTIVERPASSHGHHPPYTYHYGSAGAGAGGGKLSRAPYLGSSNIANSTGPSLRNSTNHLSANGKKRPISPEQVLRLFGQGGAAALGKALPPSHPPHAAHAQHAPPPRRHSPASSPSSTTHHTYKLNSKNDIRARWPSTAGRNSVHSAQSRTWYETARVEGRTRRCRLRSSAREQRLAGRRGGKEAVDNPTLFMSGRTTV